MASWTITGRVSLLTILGRRLKSSRLRQAITLAMLRLLLRLVLIVAALVLTTVAAWLVALPLGLATAAVSCLVLEWVVKQ